MSTPADPSGRRPIPIRRAQTTTNGTEDAPVLCERCRTPMFRMHAVWRCPSCGFKTDCCGW